MQRMQIEEKFAEPKFYACSGQKLSRAVIEDIKIEIQEQVFLGNKQVNEMLIKQLNIALNVMHALQLTITLIFK
jgi:hypothetical protein